MVLTAECVGDSPDSCGSVVQEDQESREEPWSCGSCSAEFYSVGELFSSRRCCHVDGRTVTGDLGTGTQFGGDRFYGRHCSMMEYVVG